MPLIGTAGHVDHGKSTLIERITGRDPDRWEEEKRRGLTIDLGFAWTRLPSGAEVSFVDVPGHERYLKNMLAGIEAIDIALFVVAADEGWMPQSEEHLAVLDLLEVGAGVVALTKIDAVDNDLIDLASLEIGEKLEGTTLEHAEIVPVSGRTGQGLDRLLAALDVLVGEVQPTGRERPRLWVDRAFTAAGAGTVVTGTLTDGHLAVGEVVELYPSGRQARIRGAQIHERTTERPEPGSRVALNLASIDYDDVSRGDMVGRPGEWEATDRLAASLRAARYVDELDRRGAYQFHVGSAVVQAEIAGMDHQSAVFRLSRPLPMSVGDRYILRDTGRKLVVGGGRVLDPAPARTARALRGVQEIDPESSPDEIASRLLSLRGIESAARLFRQTGGRHSEAESAGDWLLDASTIDSLQGRAAGLVQSEHEQRPLRTGLPLATLAARLGVAPEVAEMIVDRSPDLVRIGPDVSRNGREVEIPRESMETWETARTALGESLATPTVAELEIDPELLHLLVRRGDLVRISHDLVYLPSQITTIEGILRSLPDWFTVADFRDAAGLSRKYAVPILEWTDREAMTVRSGDRRRVR